MKVKKATYHEQIAHMLRDMIITGRLKVGDKVNENELCTAMGVSKTPLREALRVLNVEGLIKHIPNCGAFVTKPTFGEIKEMFDVMAVLEGFCARLATARMSNKDFSKLEKLQTKLEEKYECRDQEGYIHIKTQYHSLLQKLADNQALNQIVEGLRKKILLYRVQSFDLKGIFERSIQEHRNLLEAFRKRDPDKAEALMRLYLNNQLIALEKIEKQTEAEAAQSVSH